MVEGVNSVAEVRDTTDRVLDEQILVPHKDNPDDLHHRSSVVHSKSGRIAPRNRPPNRPRAESPSPGS